MKFAPRSRLNTWLVLGLAALVPVACLSEEEAMLEDVDEVGQAITTVRLEAEAQSWTASSGDSVDTSSSSTAARIYADATGDNFKFSQSIAAGQYKVVVRFARRNVYGSYRLDVNGVAVGNLAGYTASTSDNWSTVTLSNVSLSGSTEFKLVSTGTGGAQDYDLKVDYIEVQPASGSSTSSSSSSSSSSASSSSSSASSTSGSGGAGGTGGSGGSGGSGGAGGSGGSTQIPMTIPTPTNGSGEIRTSTTLLKNAANGGSNLYDFNNQKIGVNNTTDCDSGEGQKTVFEVQDGVTVKNLIIAGGLAGGNGIVCLGSCTLDHVYWEDVCEDAATNSKDGSTMTLNAVIAKHAPDKVFQHNSKNSTTIITNSYISDFGKLWRSCGDCTNNGGPRNLVVNNVRVETVKTAVAGANQNYGDTVTISNLFVKGGYDASDDKPKICTEYIGVTDHNGESQKVDNGASQWNTATCDVSQSDVLSY